MIVLIRRIGDEEGISLVEMLVSILLMGLVLTALGNTLVTSMAAARQNEGQTQATALVNERLERLHSATWNALVVGPAVTDPAPVVRGKRSFTITTRVQYLDSPTNRYKGFWVRANWTENGRPQQLQVDGRRSYRSGDATSGMGPTTDPFRILVFSINPDPINITATGQTIADPSLPGGTSAMLFEVRTSHPAVCGTVRVTYAPPTPAVVLTPADGTPCTAAGATNWQATVPAGATHPSGWMNFQAYATQVSPTANAVAENQAYFQAPVIMGGMVYDTNLVRSYTMATNNPLNRFCVMSNAPRVLRNDHPFYLDLRGLVADDTVELRRTDVAGVSFPMTLVNGPYGLRWTATVPGTPSTAGGTFTAGTFSQWEVKWTRTSYDNMTSTIPLQFYVFTRNGDSPCQNH